MALRDVLRADPLVDREVRVLAPTLWSTVDENQSQQHSIRSAGPRVIDGSSRVASFQRKVRSWETASRLSGCWSGRFGPGDNARRRDSPDRRRR